MSDLKRPASSISGTAAAAAASAVVAVAPKQARTELIGYAGDGSSSSSSKRQQLSSSGPARSSSLLAPIMLLTGHEAEIYCGKFSPTGAILATAGFERKILLWTVYGECENFAILTGHGGAILELKFSNDGETLVTAAADKTAAVWDLESGCRVKRLKSHTKLVNSVDIARRGPQLMCTGSDDATVKLWDRRRKGETQSFNAETAVTCVAFGDTAEQIYSAGIDNAIRQWDLRQLKQSLVLRGHLDTVTGMSLSPDGTHLLTNSCDCTLRVWDVRPYAPKERCVKLMSGHQHSFEQNLLRCAWQPDGKRISAASADRFVYIWDLASAQLVYKLPGHTGSVNETHFHPKEPIILSAGSDKKIFIGEIEPSN